LAYSFPHYALREPERPETNDVETTKIKPSQGEKIFLQRPASFNSAKAKQPVLLESTGR
jgi:hypothetical protein